MAPSSAISDLSEDIFFSCREEYNNTVAPRNLLGVRI